MVGVVIPPPAVKLLVISILTLSVTICIHSLYANIIKKSAIDADFIE